MVFLGVADEEGGGALGTGFMVERHFELFANAGVVLNEGGFIAADDGAGAVRYYAVESAQKIPLWLRLSANGQPGARLDAAPRFRAEPARGGARADLQGWPTPLRVMPELQQFYTDTAHLEPEPRREKLRDLRAALADPAFAAEFTAHPRQNAQVRNTISLTRARERQQDQRDSARGEAPSSTCACCPTRIRRRSWPTSRR